MRVPRRPFVRTRQRARANSIPGFDRTLAPRPFDWYIDRFIFIVQGEWRTSETSGQIFFQNRFDDPEVGWLRRPTGGGYHRSVVTRSKSPLNVGKIEIAATGCTGQHGRIAIVGTANPTRTLSSLLLRYGGRADFAEFIATLNPIEFFRTPSARDRAPASLDGRDNYLPASPSARELLHPDPFLRFLPIYIAMLRNMLGRAISETSVEERYEGTDQIFAPPHGEVRLHWGTIELPQVETYFERYHSRAVAAVRTAAAAIIDADPGSRLHIYGSEPEIEREADCFLVNLTVTDRHKLKIYAKTTERIRFEVKRHGRGRYNDIGAGSSPDHRLLGILLGVERDDADRLLDWRNVFQQFDEPDAPAVGELIELVSAVVRATNGDEIQTRIILDRLIVDGGFSPELDTEIDAATVAALERAGVIAQVRLRRRRPVSQHRRYSLTADFLWLRRTLLAALLPPSDPELAE